MAIRKQRRKVLRGVIAALAMIAIVLTGIVKLPKAEAEEEASIVQEYTISYDANGGTDAPVSHVKELGIETTLSTSKPKYEGHDFLGWSESPTATTATYKAGASYTEDRDIKLYAVWKVKIYVVTLADNLYDGCIASLCTLQKIHDVPLRLPAMSDTYKYTFLGYDPSRKATTPKYEKGAVYTENKNITLFAIWKEKTYDVVFDLNGGIGAAPAAVTVTPGTTVTVPTAKVSRDGYYFLGWARGSKATTPEYKSGSTLVINTTTTLYAVWKRQKVTIRYDENNGTGIAPCAKSVNKGTTVTVPKATLSREGYYFLGWATTSDALTATYKSGSIITMTESMTLYAVWKERKLALSFDANGGSGTLPASVKASYGSVVTVGKSKMSRCEFYFLGWSTDKNANTAQFKTASTLILTEDVTLYAIWKPKKYVLSYNANGGEGTLPGVVTAVSGGSVSVGKGILAREGYWFLGWATTPDATEPEYTSASTIEMTQDTVLYAVWKRNYNITLCRCLSGTITI